MLLFASHPYFYCLSAFLPTCLHRSSVLVKFHGLLFV